MKDTEYKYFKALSEVLLNSIVRRNNTIIETLSRFFYEAFRKIREGAKGKPVVYPNVYYETVYKIIELLATQPHLSNPPIEYRTAGSVWLLGEMPETEISNETYIWIWRNLSLEIKHEQDEMVMYHWQTAHQYITFSLRYIQPDYEFKSGELKEKNKEVVERRISIRRRFLEFHYALGGLLLYKQRYKVIKRMFDYTTSIPPKYELLPESMGEIFKSYNEMRDPYDRKYSFIEHVFAFPDLAGLNAGPVIKKWFSSYFALLFLRQYAIHPHLITMNPLESPQIPKTQSQIKLWIEGLPFFKTLVSQHLENKLLLEVASLSFITKEWCQINKVPHPIDFIDSLKARLEKAYETNAKNLPISPDKEKRFLDAAKAIVESAIANHSRIMNSGDIGTDVDKWYVGGQSMIQGKDPFSENPEADHLNFDTILGHGVSEAIHEGIASTFIYKTSKAFVLKPEDIFKSIDILGINDQHVIICFGIDINSYTTQIKVPFLTENHYKGVQIVYLRGTGFVDSSLFILKKADLPIISSLPINESEVTAYSLKKLSDSINLYASVVDFATAPEPILKKFADEKSEEELKKSVLLTIAISLEIRWKKDIQIIKLEEYSEYRQSGLPNTIADIRQFLRETKAE